MWAGLAASCVMPEVPPSFAMMAVATAVYAATFLVRRPAARTRLHPTTASTAV